ncbi:MAG: Fe-S-containing hydro-lyase [Spirochaetaceae bacterium]|jgi:fumarate hydratase subunit beta|nr:Fe-S-containing hydro-lyase [Spirochaetaceae bacterium]
MHLTDSFAELRAGDSIALSGFIYTARDAAHKRMIEMLDEGKPLPFPIAGSTVYYAGPSPTAPGQIIGSIGPTTSGRMDAYTPRLLSLGLKGMIGKGSRSAEVIRAMVEQGAVYFAAIGGAGALLASCVQSDEALAFEDLGTEAIHRLRIENFPVIVAIDSKGRNIYERQ